MELAQFTTEMTSRGFVGGGREFCGVWRHYPLSLAYMKGKPGGPTKFSLSFAFGVKLPDEFAGQVRDAMKGVVKLQKDEFTEKNVLAFLVEVKDDAALGKALDDLLNMVCTLARRYNLVVAIRCPLCNKENCDSYSFLDGSYVPAHAACVKNKKLRQEAAARRREEGGSVPLGVLGAALGALVGMVPTVLVMAFTDQTSALLVALVPICAWYGYRLLKGRAGWPAWAVPAVAAVLASPVADYGMAAARSLRAGGAFLQPGAYLGLYATAGSGVVAGLLQTGFFVALGLLVAIAATTRSHTSAWRGAAFATASLRPMAKEATEYMDRALERMSYQALGRPIPPELLQDGDAEGEDGR